MTKSHIGVAGLVIDTAPSGAAANELADRVLDLIWPEGMR